MGTSGSPTIVRPTMEAATTSARLKMEPTAARSTSPMTLEHKTAKATRKTAKATRKGKSLFGFLKLDIAMPLSFFVQDGNKRGRRLTHGPIPSGSHDVIGLKTIPWLQLTYDASTKADKRCETDRLENPTGSGAADPGRAGNE